MAFFVPSELGGAHSVDGIEFEYNRDPARQVLPMQPSREPKRERPGKEDLKDIVRQSNTERKHFESTKG